MEQCEEDRITATTTTTTTTIEAIAAATCGSKREHEREHEGGVFDRNLGVEDEADEIGEDVMPSPSKTQAPEGQVHQVRRTKSGRQLIDTLLYPLKQSASLQALDQHGEGATTKMQLVACTGQDCEVMDLKQGNIFLPPFAKTSVKFEWLECPKNVLVVIKPGEPETQQALVDVGIILTERYKISVYVEKKVHEHIGKFLPWNAAITTDFIITLGGDGTVLWVSSLFPKGVPPVLSFAMGTLGFLTSFPFSSHEKHLRKMVEGNQFLSLRTRMRCKLYSYNNNKGSKGGKGGEELVGTYAVLNEVSVNRGPSSNLVDIDLFCDGIPVTKVQADGVLVSTPTGSTAYSLSAGGSLVHPAVSAMLFTPICPHSLSFRPLLFPDAVTLQLQIPHVGRNRGGICMVAFDGKHKFEMGPGDCVTIQMSPHPLPSVVCKTDTEDWFQSLNGGLHWNMPNEEMRKQNTTPLDRKASSHL